VGQRPGPLSACWLSMRFPFCGLVLWFGGQVASHTDTPCPPAPEAHAARGRGLRQGQGGSWARHNVKGKQGKASGARGLVG